MGYLSPYGAAAGPQFADDETPAGAIDGVNTVFTLARAPSPAASLLLYLNGIVQRPAGADYTLAGNSITFNAAPQIGDNLEAWYRY